MKVPLIVGASIVICAIGTASAAPDVTTTGGTLSGRTVGGVDQYLGIPYASPPVGPLRFAPPGPAPVWSGVRDATRFGSSCPQPASPFGIASTNENCLFVNVYRPTASKPSRSLPVMVWIHGGAFIDGEGSDYDGSTLASRGNIILVTINYRLGALGFLTTPGLGGTTGAEAAGNYGLMDQQAALRWVRANAASFGGDPHLVTVFGESAGGQSVVDLLASPTATGLFERAIIESGAYMPAVPTVSSLETTQSGFVDSLGCGTNPSRACLQALPVSVYTNAELALSASGTPAALTSFGPSVGDTLLPIQPLKAIVAGHFNNVPVINGSNHDEGRLFSALAFDLQGAPLTASGYPAAVDALLGPTLGSLALVQYPLSAYPSPDVAYATLFTDAGFACGAELLDEALVSHRAPFAYEFADEGSRMLFVPPVSFPYGSSHTNEIGYLYPNIVGNLTGYTEQFSSSQRALSDAMINAWTAFAHFGIPTPFHGTPWLPFIGPNFESLVPEASAISIGFTAEHKCGFWLPLLALEAGLTALPSGN